MITYPWNNLLYVLLFLLLVALAVLSVISRKPFWNAKLAIGQFSAIVDFFAALFSDFMEIVELLVLNGADVNAKTKDGHTALTLACEKVTTGLFYILHVHVFEIKLQNR